MVAGRYTLIREVGRGGMGSVWLARDEVLHREVAVKRLGHGDFDVARAAREARLAASLNHPHVVGVFDLVEESGERWLVMEYVAGRTLSAVTAEAGGLPPLRAARLLAQAAEALAVAHANGVVHRDVKPSNMLVTDDDTLKLSDFGIARAFGDATMTQTGMVTGSPAYLSPEVARGERATPASDVWSLGATTFHALAGRPPYESDGNAVATLYQVVHHDPPTLPDAHPLAPLLQHTMARDPDARWAMGQVHDYLVSVAAGVSEGTMPVRVPSGDLPLEPPPADETQVLSPASRPAARRSPALALAVAGLVALLVVAWAVAQLGGGTDDDGPPAAERPGSGQSRDETSPSSETPPGPTADGMEQFVADYLSTATTDPKDSWPMLTPAFQDASRNFGQYQKFWRQQRSAEPSSIVADPEQLRVEYDVRYDRVGVGTVDDHVVLRLVFEDGAYLIDAEE